MKLFVTSDVHSYYRIFRDELEKLGFDEDNPDHIILVCGDLFDRGEDSVSLFKFLKKLKDRFIYVRGNHEDLLFECMDVIECGYIPSHHHFSNGTVKTICQFCDDNEMIIFDPDRRKKIISTMKPILKWIDEKSVDYYETDEFVFVHGWFPCYEGLDNFKDATPEDWKNARWDNGMERWMNSHCRVNEKTVVCGHWHCSWGWSVITGDRTEFPIDNTDMTKHFEPWVDDGIIAIDACTAFSGVMNILVFEI